MTHSRQCGFRGENVRLLSGCEVSTISYLMFQIVNALLTLLSMLTLEVVVSLSAGKRTQ